MSAQAACATRTQHSAAPFSAAVASLLCVALAFASLPARAQTVPLGTASTFGALGGSTVTNTGPTVVTGDLGVSPGSAITGFPPGVVVGGAIHAADAVAAQAQSDVTTAYNDAAGRPGCTPIAGGLLGSGGATTLGPGVYCMNAGSLTGSLTLSGAGVYIFQMGSTLTTASGSSIALINGASACNVFWQVGSSATIGTGSTMAGTILALTSITVTTGASMNGAALARNGAVTLDTNTVSACAGGPPPPPPPPPGSGAISAPTLSAWMMFVLISLLLAIGYARTRRTL